MHNFLPFAYFQNQFVPFNEAKISIATHALHYGTGAFGGLRAIPDPQKPEQILLFRLDRHCQRLSSSAKLLQYDLPADKINEFWSSGNRFNSILKPPASKKVNILLFYVG